MERVKKIIVSIKFFEAEIDVGELVENGDRIYFKYYSDFLKKGLNISPFKLPLSDEIRVAEPHLFNGLVGVFNDSLPDGWGQLLLDRKLLAKGVMPQQIGPLDRLAYVGSSGMGALSYRPEIITTNDADQFLELDSIANEMNQVYEGTSIEVIDQLFKLGGSSGGARPKILVGFDKENNQLIHGVNDLPEAYSHWLIKFPTSNDFPDIANVEYAYYQMALDAGIIMNESQLFSGASGKSYFGTKRFDRQENQKLHMHSASGLLHDDFRRSTMDYGHLMDAAFQLKKEVGVYEEMLRLAAFNIYSHNRDDHSKNFSFLMNEKGLWEIAPAYDLTFSSSSHGMHSTMVAGESSHPGEKNITELATDFGVKNVSEIIEQVKTICSKWTNYAKNAGVGKTSSSFIEKKITQLIKT